MKEFFHEFVTFSLKNRFFAFMSGIFIVSWIVMPALTSFKDNTLDNICVGLTVSLMFLFSWALGYFCKYEDDFNTKSREINR